MPFTPLLLNSGVEEEECFKLEYCYSQWIWVKWWFPTALKTGILRIDKSLLVAIE